MKSMIIMTNKSDIYYAIKIKFKTWFIHKIFVKSAFFYIYLCICNDIIYFLASECIINKTRGLFGILLLTFDY
jgi:hypothetical protein